MLASLQVPMVQGGSISLIETLLLSSQGGLEASACVDDGIQTG